jgi:hypothetical protein
MPLESFKTLDMSMYTLPMFAVFEKPIDHPNQYVVRLFDCNRPTEHFIVKKTLKEIRRVIPKNLLHFPRSSMDEKHIVETWV